jgi:hypothetical protein
VGVKLAITVAMQAVVVVKLPQLGELGSTGFAKLGFVPKVLLGPDAGCRPDQKPQAEKVHREDRHKHGGMLVDETLQVVGRHSHASEPYRIFYPIPRRAER